MAKVAIFTNATGSGVVKAQSGVLWAVNITKVGTGSSFATVYDNATTNSGNKLFDGDGLVQGSFQLNDGNGGAVAATTGMYCDVGGTTKPTVVVVYD